MTRPTDASLARAFWSWLDAVHSAPRTMDALELLTRILAEAQQYDAEATTTDDRCKVCGGGNVYCAACMSKSAPEVTTSPERVQVPAESERGYCPLCTGNVWKGRYCNGPKCPLRPA